MEITSVNNDLVKETVKLLQKKYRDKEDKFILEGAKCVEEAICAGLEIEHIFVLRGKENNFSFCHCEESLSSTSQSPVDRFLKKIVITTEPVLKKISATDSVPEVVAVARKKHYDIKDLKDVKKVVLLENIKDLGNLGTILRTSVAFGVDAVVLYGRECADIYNPKCVRSTVGNLWKIPVVYIEDFEEIKRVFKGFERVATLPRANNYLKNFEVKTPFVVMFGSEADGLSDELANLSTERVKIEMSDSVESLNLSVSCAVVLYKLFV